MLSPFERRSYFYMRRTLGHSASYAMAVIRAKQRHRQTLAQFGDWKFTSGAFGSFACADHTSLPLRVYIGDDEPTDWGDSEPTDAERENASSFYVQVEVMMNDDVVYDTGIGGVDVIDLPGYAEQNFEDAAAYALEGCLLADAIAWLENETRESAHWAARDTITTD